MTFEEWLVQSGYNPTDQGGVYSPQNPYSENGQAPNVAASQLMDDYLAATGQANSTPSWGTVGRPKGSYDAEAGHSDNGIPETVTIDGRLMRRVGEGTIYGHPSQYDPKYGYLFPEDAYQGLVAQHTQGDWSEILGNQLPVILASIVTGGGASVAAGAAGASSMTAAAVGGAVGGATKGGFSGDNFSLSGAAKGAALGAAGGAAANYVGSAINSPVPTGGGNAVGGGANVTVGTANQFAGGATTDVVGRELVDGSGLIGGAMPPESYWGVQANAGGGTPFTPTDSSGYAFDAGTGDTVGVGGTPSSSLSFQGGAGGADDVFTQLASGGSGSSAPYNFDPYTGDTVGAGGTPSSNLSFNGGTTPYNATGYGGNPGAGSSNIFDDAFDWVNKNKTAASIGAQLVGGLIQGASAPAAAKSKAQAEAEAQKSVELARLQNTSGANSRFKLRPTGAMLRRPGIIRGRM